MRGAVQRLGNRSPQLLRVLDVFLAGLPDRRGNRFRNVVRRAWRHCRRCGEAASRFSYLGFRQLRVRHHGELARIEIDPVELPRALDPEQARAMVAALKPLGFRFVALDLEGYRTGALNEVLGGVAAPLLQIERVPGA